VIRRGTALRAAASVLAGTRVASDGAVVLAYHDVLPSAGGYHVTPHRLRAQLELVRSSGLEFVELASIVERLERGESVRGLASVTFDDGLLGVAEHGMEVLEALGVPATVFVVTEGMGTPPRWWQGAQRTLSAAEVASIASTSHIAVASHCCTHRSLPSLADPDLAYELTCSRASLEDLLGRRVDLLAYPSGEHDERVRAASSRSGYRAAFTFRNGRVTPDLDRHMLPRFTMGSHHHRLRLSAHLARAAARWPDTQCDSPDATAAARSWT